MKIPDGYGGFIGDGRGGFLDDGRDENAATPEVVAGDDAASKGTSETAI